MANRKESKLVYGRVVNVVSDDKRPFTTITVKNEQRCPVQVHNDVYEQAVEKHGGTLWDQEVEIEEIEVNGKTRKKIRVY
jgi:hypothetical protein